MNRISKFLAAHSFVLLFVYLLLIAGSVQAATVLFPSGGGLGNNVAPTLGKIPVGTSGGVYAPTSTIRGPITVTGTSTLATTTVGGIFTLPQQSTGCAQFSSIGILTSTGV